MQPVATEPIKVFLVDDHKAVLWGLQRLIESAVPLMAVAGVAANRAEMLAKLPSANPDVILLDLDLGDENSMDWMQELRGSTSARVLVLTGSNDPAVHHKAVARGARGVIHKQVRADVLLRAIEKVHLGEIWLDRAALGSVMENLASESARNSDANKADALTEKEREIIAAIVAEPGAGNKVIADKLGISDGTLRNHLSIIYSKLGVKGRIELYRYATNQEASPR